MGNSPRGGGSFGIVIAFPCCPYKLTQNAPGDPDYALREALYMAKAKFTQSEPVCAVSIRG